MRNKYYNIFFTSEDNDFRKTIRLSKIILMLFLFFGIIFFCLALIGAYRFTNHDNLIRKSRLLEYENFDLKSKITSNDSLISLQPLAAPVEGFVTKGVSVENGHNGIDIASIKGSFVKATLDGIVVFSGYDSIMGNTIILAHNNNLFSLYGHNDTNLVESRDFVEVNFPIAKVGNSGTSDGPHLHFEIWDGKKIIDPRNLIKDYKEKDVSIK